MDQIKLEEFEEDEDDWLSHEIDNFIRDEYQNFNVPNMNKFEFKILGEIIKEDKEGKEYVYKRIVYKIYEDVNNLGPVTQVVNSNGTISKSRCSVFFQNLQTSHIVKHPYEEIIKLKEFKRTVIKGFRK